MTAKIGTNILEYNEFAQIAFITGNFSSTPTLVRGCDNQLTIEMDPVYDST